MPEHLQPVLEAFLLLHESRPLGFGNLGGITTVDIMAMAPHVEPDEPLRFLRAIRAMDALVLADHAKNSRAADTEQ